MNNQEIFDKVWAHFIVGGARSGRSGFGCVYRSPEGLMCAVGCLIPADEKFLALHDHIGGISSMHIKETSLLHEALGDVDLSFLINIQSAHDSTAWLSSFHKQFEVRLRDLADAEELTVPA